MNSHIVFFDLEATGTDVATAKIVQFAAVKYPWFGFEGPVPPKSTSLSFTCNPGVKMSDEVIKIHGITNESVAGLPTFERWAGKVYDFIRGCDISGYNAINYDIPLLWEELHREGIEWDLSGSQVIDPGNIFKKMEERALSAAVKFYCGRDHEGAHSALADAQATADVLIGQMRQYPDIGRMTVAELAKFSKMDDRIDLAGKITRNAQGEAVYNIGKAKGERVMDNPSFGYWMLQRDFTENTKRTLELILNAPQPTDEP